ncbi:MAG: hypothetical protein J6B85_10640 [Lachnospiraceae bacterium]|nr:hypothetical protein [Lachnospiraceae bacterium]
MIPEKYLFEQSVRHPSMRAQDIVKLCYQAAYGAEHLLSDPEAARRYFDSEYASVAADPSEQLYEEISPEVCRVNLTAWKVSGMPAEWLFRMFAASASASADAAFGSPSKDGEGGDCVSRECVQSSRELLKEYLKTAGELIASGRIPISQEEWTAYLTRYLDAGMGAVHHSEPYRSMERPAYRIVGSRFLRVLPILQKAAILLDGTNSEEYKSEETTFEKAPACIIAIDGRAASGKSTTAALLETVLDAGVIHMDDFFLPPALRTDARFRTPGGNVHWERFAEEVLPFLKIAESFSYRIFDCGEMDYNSERIVKASPWRIVEGSYSCHPELGRYADVNIYSDVRPEEQLRRIVQRNGEQMAELFRKRWIPLEEAYFEACRVKETADIIV